MQIDTHGAVTYCCLGVACVLVRDRIPVEIGVTLAGNRVTAMVVRDDTGATSSSLLTPGIAQFYGFTSDNPDLRVLQTDADKVQLDHYTNATIANDELEMDFAAIADAFERTYLPDDVTQ